MSLLSIFVPFVLTQSLEQNSPEEEAETYSQNELLHLFALGKTLGGDQLRTIPGSKGIIESGVDAIPTGISLFVEGDIPDLKVLIILFFSDSEHGFTTSFLWRQTLSHQFNHQ